MNKKETKEANKYVNAGDYQYFKQHVKLGNRKISKNTMIFNMNAATDCPSYKCGYCTVGQKICYAKKAEVLYPEVLGYRRTQEMIWKTHSAFELADMFAQYVRERHKRTKPSKIEFFRYNESGDFKDAEDVEKLDTIAQRLHDEFGIVTFGYTARADLFEGTNARDYDFVVKMSGKFVKGFTTTTVWAKDHTDILNRDIFNAEHTSLTMHTTYRSYSDSKGTKGDHFLVCPQQLHKEGKLKGWVDSKKEFKCMGSCMLCSSPSINVAFLKH